MSSRGAGYISGVAILAVGSSFPNCLSFVGIAWSFFLKGQFADLRGGCFQLFSSSALPGLSENHVITKGDDCWLDASP